MAKENSEAYSLERKNVGCWLGVKFINFPLAGSCTIHQGTALRLSQQGSYTYSVKKLFRHGFSIQKLEEDSNPIGAKKEKVSASLIDKIGHRAERRKGRGRKRLLSSIDRSSSSLSEEMSFNFNTLNEYESKERERDHSSTFRFSASTPLQIRSEAS